MRSICLSAFVAATNQAKKRSKDTNKYVIYATTIAKKLFSHQKMCFCFLAVCPYSPMVSVDSSPTGTSIIIDARLA